MQDKGATGTPRPAPAALWLWLPALLYAGLIFTLSSHPAPGFVSIFTNEDKMLHFGEYGVFGLLLARAMAGSARGPQLALSYALAIGVGTATASADEWYQASVPGRSSSAWDLSVDVLALVLAAVAIHVLRRRMLRHRAASPGAVRVRP